MSQHKFFPRLIICAACVAFVDAAEPVCHAQKPANATRDPIADAFARLKAFVGDWEQQSALNGAPKGMIALQFRVAAGGSAIVETLLPNELIFESVGGGNFDAAKDLHVRGGIIRFIDSDHIHAKWSVCADGEELGEHSLDLTRKKK